MEAFPIYYYTDIVERQGKVFYNVREELPGVDEKWFFGAYMRSDIRRKLDHANPSFAAMPSRELIDYFIEHECNGEYPRGDEWGGFLPLWVGRIYAHYQWKYNIPSAQVIELLPLEDMERYYIPFHQMGWEAAIEKLHSIVNE